MGILIALEEREKSGKGQGIDAAMTDLRDDLDRVRKQSKLTGAQIDWLLANSGEDRDLPHEKPPHY